MHYSYKHFGQALEEIIAEKQIKLRSLAKKTNLNYSYFSKLKKKSSPPPPKTMKDIAKGLGISPYYFFEYRLHVLEEFLFHNPSLARKVMDYTQKIAAQHQLKVADGKIPFTNSEK